jgi:NAD-dependent SIR2 family protein deacetylase
MFLETVLTSRSSPTAFELLLESLAQNGCIKRVYTQNYDFRLTRLPVVSKRTVHLHGRLDRQICTLYPGQHKFPKDPKQGMAIDDVVRFLSAKPLSQHCIECQEIEERRIENGKRSHRTGYMLPDVLDYDQHHPDETDVLSQYNIDVKSADALLVVGTRANTTTVKEMVHNFSQMILARDGPVLWVSNEKPKVPWLGDYFIGDCDEFAKAMSR